MKYLRFALIIPLVCTLWPLLSAQTPTTNRDKYWHYRDRFLGLDGEGGFISIGPGAGQSLPASGRNRDCNCEWDWFIRHLHCSPKVGKGKMEWGDGTVYLGYYIAMLAMEYGNLQRDSADLSAISREIHYALYAFERLDSLAETYLDLEPQLNGFFVRDDVPCDFYLNEAGDFRFTHSDTSAFECIQSAGCCTGSDGTVDGGSFVSQDQALAMLFGFSFIKKFAEDGRYLADGPTFGSMVELFTHRMVAYMRECNWRLKSPDGEPISNRWGGDLRAFNAVFAEVAEKITEGRFETDYDKKTFLGKLIRGTFNWGFGIQSRRNHAMIFQSVVMTDRWSPRRIAKRTRKADQVVFALAYAVLNDEPLHRSFERSDFEEMLDLAPWDGPCHGTPGCEAPDGWKSTDRWWHANHKDGNPYGLAFEWGGIDYMLFYNLFHYYYQDDLPAYPRPIIEHTGVEQVRPLPEKESEKIKNPADQKKQ